MILIRSRISDLDQAHTTTGINVIARMERNQMSDAVAEIRRGGRVESLHPGIIAVADVSGRLVASVGDPSWPVFFRSSAKPFQAIPLIETGAADRFAFTDAELALACASHNAEARHQQAVAAMLTKVGLDPTALRCGCPLPSDREAAARVVLGIDPPSPLQCDCSGKHTGMLATAVHLSEPIADYLAPSHPVQQRVRTAVATLLRCPAEDLLDGTDGCSLPTFGAPISSFAVAYATFAAPTDAPAGAGRDQATTLLRLRAAMLAHPENVAGTGELVSDLMAIGEGRLVAKSGAEGLLCLAAPKRGLGIAIRILDGSFRAHAAVAFSLIEQLDLLDAARLAALRERHPATIRNHNGWEVGEIRASFELSRPASGTGGG